MGYYMSLSDQNFCIKQENFDAALAAIKAMYDDPDAKMSGSTWQQGKETERFFGWVSTEEVMKAETLDDALMAWRWPRAEWVDTEDITALEFEGQKFGDDYELMKAIAPFVEDDSYLHMVGEDGEHWRWYFLGGKCVEQQGVITWV
jgi:hypothetical protein